MTQVRARACEQRSQHIRVRGRTNIVRDVSCLRKRYADTVKMDAGIVSPLLAILLLAAVGK